MFLANSDPTSIYDLISKGGVPALLLIIIYGGFRKWWVWGYQLRESNERLVVLRGERDEWKNIALLSANLADSLDKIRKENK